MTYPTSPLGLDRIQLQSCLMPAFPPTMAAGTMDNSFEYSLTVIESQGFRCALSVILEVSEKIISSNWRGKRCHDGVLGEGYPTYYCCLVRVKNLKFLPSFTSLWKYRFAARLRGSEGWCHHDHTMLSLQLLVKHNIFHLVWLTARLTA